MPINPSPSQYATTTQLQQLALTPAAYTRFETANPGCTTVALQAASAEADSYLAGQFALPLVQWDLVLARAVCRIAAYSLYVQFGFNPNAPIDQNIERGYKEAIAWLTQIATNDLSPQYIDSSSDGEPAGPFVINGNSNSVFNDCCDDDGNSGCF